MNRYELIAPCHFGMEAVLKREINDLGYEISKVENGKVTFLADAEGIRRGNIFLRTTERILLKVAEFKAETFDELFSRTGVFLKEVIEPHLKEEKDILIIGHGAMNASIACQIKNIPIEKFWSVGLEQCKIIKLL